MYIIFYIFFQFTSCKFKKIRCNFYIYKQKLNLIKVAITFYHKFYFEKDLSTFELCIVIYNCETLEYV